MTVLVQGDQLTRIPGPLADHDGHVLVIETREFARPKPCHPHELALVLAAMRRFRGRLRDAGHAVDYRTCEPFADGLEAHSEDDLTVVRLASRGGADRMREPVTDAGGSLTVLADERFRRSPTEFDELTCDRDSLTHESFYRYMHRETGYLTGGDGPVGGEWNYDDRKDDEELAEIRDRATELRERAESGDR